MLSWQTASTSNLQFCSTIKIKCYL